MQTTRGKFNISIETSTYSAVQYGGFDVATCARNDSEFKLTSYVSIVPPNLLGEFGDVITEATRLLLEARAAVNKANTVAPSLTKAPRPLYALEYWINTTDTTHAGEVGISAYMTYDPNTNTSVYRYYSVEKGEWISGSTRDGRNTFFQTNAVWSTQKPDEDKLARDGRITYNKALIATLVKREDPVQFLKSDDNRLIALVLNGTRHSLFHITSVGIDSPSAFINNLHTWTRDAALDGAEQIDDMRITPISLNDALTLRPHLKDAVAYRPDSDMAKNSIYYTRNFSTGEELKWRYDSRTQAWQPSSPLGSLAPINWAHPSANGWSIGDSSVTSLKDTYLKSLTPSGAEVLKSALASLPPIAFFKSTGSNPNPTPHNYYFAYVRRGTSKVYDVYQVYEGGEPSSLKDLISRHTYTVDSIDADGPSSDENFQLVSRGEFEDKFPVLAAARLYQNNGPNITYTLDFLTQSHAMHARHAVTKALSCTRDDEWPWSGSAFPVWNNLTGSLWSTNSTQFDYIHNEDNFKPAPKYLVPNVHFDEHGTFKFKPFYVAFYEKIGGQWMSYSGMLGTRTPVHHIPADSDGEGLAGYHTLDKVPTPIGYRLFDTTKNEWLQPAKDGITLFSTADGYTPMSGNEMRPWYGPSLVTK